MTKEEKQVNFFKKAAINLTENNFILQHAISEFKKYLENEISLCSLAITACGVDAESAHVHRLYRDRFKEKLKDCDIEKIILEGKELMLAFTLPDEGEKECDHVWKDIGYACSGYLKCTKCNKTHKGITTP